MDVLDIDIALTRRSFDLRAKLTLGPRTVALVGASGAGKTSLLRAVAGLERPHAGRIGCGRDGWFDAERRIHLTPERRRVGYLPQDYGLFPHLTVAGNVRFAGRRDRPDLLERMGIAHLADARPRHLSGGERQRAALARALARHPRVLLLDEPFGALDAISRHEVRDELGDILARLQLPTLLVTHSFDDATALASMIGVIDRGTLVQLGPPAELLRAPANATVAGLVGANVLDGIATPTRAGCVVKLGDGDSLVTSTRAEGPVQIAVYPWALELADPATSSLTDTVVSVRQDRGTLIVRLTRLAVEAPMSSQGSVPLMEGAVVGIRAAPGEIHVLDSSGALPEPIELDSHRQARERQRLAKTDHL
jgi:molybdate transport system ATP-binding protein